MSTKSKYLILDTEATGFFPGRHGLIQLACVSLDKNFNISDEYISDVRPPEGIEFSEEALKITGFTKERIANGISYLALSEEFLKFLEKNFTQEEKPITIAQFYPFDFALLQHVFTQVGFEEKIIQSWLSNDFIDTKALVHGVNASYRLRGKKEPFPSTSLSRPGGLRDKFGIKGKYKVHDAMGDVMATREVLIKILESLKFED